MMMRPHIPIISLLSLLPAAVWGQKERADIRWGNLSYYEGKYPEAEVGYRRALEKNITSYEANFNLGGALYKQGRYDDAAAAYGRLADDGTDRRRQASACYNLGNTLVRQRKLDEAIEAYKNALRLVPDDQEAKFNLAYARKLKQEEEKNDPDNNQDNRDRNNPDNNRDQNNPDNQNNQDQNNPDNRNDNDPNKPNDPDDNRNNPDNRNHNDPNKPKNDPGDNRQSPDRQPSASREESERLLRAIQASEDNTKKRVDAEKAQAVGTRNAKQW